MNALLRWYRAGLDLHARIIPLDGRPRPDIESWTGESRGHWEGRTLVVETRHFSHKHGYRASGNSAPPRRSSGPRTGEAKLS